MTEQKVRALLAQHPFVKNFKPSQIDKLATLAREVRFVEDQIVFREGDQSADFNLIISGRVALEINEPDQTLRIQTLNAGDEFGWSALIAGSGKYFQARALEPVEALAFSGDELLQTCKQDTDFGFGLMTGLLGIVAERLQATRLQLHDMYSLTAKRAGA